MSYTPSYIKQKAVISVVTTLCLRAMYIPLMALTLMDCTLLDGNIPMTDGQGGNWLMVEGALLNYFLHLMGLEAAPR